MARQALWLTLSLLLLPWNGAGSITPMFGKDKIRIGHNFSLDCNPDVANVPEGADVIVLFLIIKRQVEEEMRQVLLASFGMAPVFFKGYLPPVTRDWRVVHEGYRNELNYFNRATVHLSLSTDNASCQDAGLYQCVANYEIPARNISRRDTAPTNTTIYWDSDVVTLTVSPANYTHGDVLHLRCESYHAEAVEPSYRWNVRCGDEPFQDWPYESSNASREIQRDLDFPCRPQKVWNSRQWTFDASIVCFLQCFATELIEDSRKLLSSNELRLGISSSEKMVAKGLTASALLSFFVLLVVRGC